MRFVLEVARDAHTKCSRSRALTAFGPLTVTRTRAKPTPGALLLQSRVRASSGKGAARLCPERAAGLAQWQVGIPSHWLEAHCSGRS